MLKIYTTPNITQPYNSHMRFPSLLIRITRTQFFTPVSKWLPNRKRARTKQQKHQKICKNATARVPFMRRRLAVNLTVSSHVRNSQTCSNIENLISNYIILTRRSILGDLGIRLSEFLGLEVNITVLFFLNSVTSKNGVILRTRRDRNPFNLRIANHLGVKFN